MRLAAVTCVTSVILIVLAAQPTYAQETDDPAVSYSSLINIDSLIENHVRFLARKYTLSDDQEAFTEEYLHTRADEFLKHHRDEMFNLVDQLFAVRAGGDMSQQDLVEWGKHALPLYQEAKLLIVEGNAEWREVLTPEQQLIHDQDLDLMYRQFNETEDQLERIVTGQMTVDEFRRGPGKLAGSTPRRKAPSIKPQTPTKSPTAAPAPAGKPGRTVPAEKPADKRPPSRRPSPRRGSAAKPDPGAGSDNEIAERIRERAAQQRRSGGKSRPSRNRPARVDDDYASQWERYVEDFITRYKLDDGQTERARAILKDCQEQANRHMQRAKPRIDQLERQMEKTGSEERAAKLRERLDQQKQRLLQPIGIIFESRLKPSLEKLPTRAQRAAAANSPARNKDRDRKPGRPDNRKPGQRNRK